MVHLFCITNRFISNYPSDGKLSGLNLLSLSNIIKTTNKKVEFFLSINVTYLLNQQYTKLLGKSKNHWWQISILNPETYCIPRRKRLLVQTTKQPLRNFEAPKLSTYKQLWGWRLILVAYRKNKCIELSKIPSDELNKKFRMIYWKQI